MFFNPYQPLFFLDSKEHLSILLMTVRRSC